MVVDRINHLVDRFVDISDRNSDNSVAPSSQIRISCVVALRFVTFAVDLDDEPRCMAQKIDGVRPDRHLAPKFVTSHLTTAEPRPHEPFRLGHVVAQVSRVIGLGRWHFYTIEMLES